MKSQSFLKHAAIYGLASMLMQAAGFVLLPLYTRYLAGSRRIWDPRSAGPDRRDRGDRASFGRFSAGMLTFYQQASDETERRQVVSTAFVLAGGACLVRTS